MPRDRNIRGIGTAVKITALHLPEDVQDGNFVMFPFCMTPSFVFKVESKWSSTTAYGKMDEIPFYSNTTKTLSVAFTATIPQKISRQYRLIDLNRSVAKLQQMQYPLYKTFPMDGGGLGYNVIKAPPFFMVEHMDMKDGKYSYMAPVQGYMAGNGLVVEPGHAKKKLVGGKTMGDGGGAVLEKQFEISFDLVVLHELLPGYNEGGAFTGDNMYNFQSLSSKQVAYGFTSDGSRPNPQSLISEITKKAPA